MITMPYTFEELLTVNRETVYLEYRYPEYNSGYRKARWVRAFLGYKTSPNTSLYGKTWRCWERMPSEEETKNAAWKGEEK